MRVATDFIETCHCQFFLQAFQLLFSIYHNQLNQRKQYRKVYQIYQLLLLSIKIYPSIPKYIKVYQLIFV